MPKGIFIRTQEFRRKLAEIRKLRHLGFGNKNPNWKGDNVGISGLQDINQNQNSVKFVV